MPVSGYVSSVIPVLLMVWFGSILERWLKSWMPTALKMFLVPLATMTVSIVLGYLVIGPVATLITNLLSAAFSFIFQLPVVGSVLGSALVGGLWMCLVIFGFHWSLIPISIMNLNTSATTACSPPPSATGSRSERSSLPCTSETRTSASAASPFPR